MKEKADRMNIPGFTAEASLYQTSERYQMAGVSHVLTDGRQVMPQFCYSPRPGLYCCWTPWFGVQCRLLHFIE